MSKPILTPHLDAILGLKDGDRKEESVARLAYTHRLKASVADVWVLEDRLKMIDWLMVLFKLGLIGLDDVEVKK